MPSPLTSSIHGMRGGGSPMGPNAWAPRSGSIPYAVLPCPGTPVQHSPGPSLFRTIALVPGSPMSSLRSLTSSHTRNHHMQIRQLDAFNEILRRKAFSLVN